MCSVVTDIILIRLIIIIVKNHRLGSLKLFPAFRFSPSEEYFHTPPLYRQQLCNSQTLAIKCYSRSVFYRLPTTNEEVSAQGQYNVLHGVALLSIFCFNQGTCWVSVSAPRPNLVCGHWGCELVWNLSMRHDHYSFASDKWREVCTRWHSYGNNQQNIKWWQDISIGII